MNSMRLRATQLLNMSGKVGRTRTARSASPHPYRKTALNTASVRTQIATLLDSQAGRSTGNAVGQ